MRSAAICRRSEGSSGTLVIYVFDVLDRDGARVYRVSGQLSSVAGVDPGRGVSDEMLGRVAAEAMAAIEAWADPA